MDTRYWGPSGWRLLHLISFSKEPAAGALREFFTVLPYILPCKYCRQSLSEYMEADPVPATGTSAFPKWLWRIHNQVNAKLRKQKLCVVPDPPFQSVKQLYMERLHQGCTRTLFEGWEFLFSVAEAHPLSAMGRSSLPLEGAPDGVATGSDLEQNRWNVLAPEKRLPYFVRFWQLLPQVLPFREWSTVWAKAGPKAADWRTRAASLRTLWGIRCAMESQLELLNQTDYSSLCKELKSYRSGCNKSRRGKTCRRKKTSSVEATSF